jgi:hypothetical protein
MKKQNIKVTLSLNNELMYLIQLQNEIIQDISGSFSPGQVGARMASQVFLDKDHR